VSCRESNVEFTGDKSINILLFPPVLTKKLPVTLNQSIDRTANWLTGSPSQGDKQLGGTDVKKIATEGGMRGESEAGNQTPNRLRIRNQNHEAVQGLLLL
jgi:hypothetical protein